MLLVKRISEAKNIYLCPSEVKGKYIIRFAVCAKSTTEQDIEYSWREIQRLGDQVLVESNETKFFPLTSRELIKPAAAAADNKIIISNMSSNQQLNQETQQQESKNSVSQIVKMNGKINVPVCMNRSFSEVSVVNLPRLNDLKTAYTNLLEAAGEDIYREGLLKTPERAAKAFEFFTAGYHQDLKGE